MPSFLTKSVDSLVQSFDGQLDSLETDTATVDYICDLLLDLSVEEDEKQETIQGIFELHLDPSRARTSASGSETGEDDGTRPAAPSLPDAVQTLLRAAQTYLADPAAHAAARTPSPPDSPARPAAGREPSPDAAEREQLKRKALLATYGHIPDPDPPPTSSTLAPREPPPGSEPPPKELLDQHLKLLDMKKRQRKKAESKLDHPDLLLRPNLNSALIDHQKKLEREQSAQKSKAKAEKDKADLQKQKETQLKKKSEARARCTKSERKA